MFKIRRAITTLSLVLGSGLAVAVAETPVGRGPQKSAAPLLAERADPRAFGTEDYSVTVLSATKFAYPIGDLAPQSLRILSATLRFR